MEDQAESLRKLMKEKGIDKERKQSHESEQDINDLEKKAEVTDDKIEALADQIINYAQHHNTQAEDLAKAVIKKKVKELEAIEKLDEKIHARLEKKLKEHSQEQAQFVRTLIKELTDK